MREIKFRCWHKELAVMVNAYIVSWQKHAGVNYTKTCKGYYGENEQIEFSLDEVELMQYTGLKDKNGKEIYEGDVIKCGQFDRICKVEFLDGCFYAPYDNSRYRYRVGGFDVKKVEVIGNIYESPELLKQIL